MHEIEQIIEGYRAQIGEVGGDGGIYDPPIRN